MGLANELAMFCCRESSFRLATWVKVIELELRKQE